MFIDEHDDAILGSAEVDGDLLVVYERGAIIRDPLKASVRRLDVALFASLQPRVPSIPAS